MPFLATFFIWTTNVNPISILAEGMRERQGVEGGWWREVYAMSLRKSLEASYKFISSRLL